MTASASTQRDEARASPGVALAVVGAGRMGGAVVEGALRSGALDPEHLGVFHPDP